MKFDRGIIKWQPFDSVISGKKIIYSLVKEKEKAEKPELSEEEIFEIENKIIAAFYDQTIINIQYYKNGYILNTTGKIKKIDHITKMIYLNNLTLFFNQILSIY